MKTGFSGGEIRSGSAVWNPPPPKPKPPSYRLIVEQTGATPAELTAVAGTVEALIAFEAQTRRLHYDWVKLERFQPPETMAEQLTKAGAFDPDPG